jgi:competence protein ComEC
VDIDLLGVDIDDQLLPLSGGMRLGFTPSDSDPALPEVHAGDEVTVLTLARLPLSYKDDGAFNRREFLAQQQIDLLATLRASSLLHRIASSPTTPAILLARARAKARARLDALFAASPATSSILRAMLLGDRSFVDRSESVDFQKTGVFHVLVVAGLHLGALVFFLYWFTRRLRLPQPFATPLILLALLAYISIVEQRPPVLRAGLMTAIVMLGGYFYRRLELLNSAALAVLILLVARPHSIFDGSFQLSFLAIGCIAGVALPVIDRFIQPYVRLLRNWRDVTRDTSLPPRLAQFRLDLRDAAFQLAARLPTRSAQWSQDAGVRTLGWTFRASELFLLSFVLQFGMLPLMARDFHRIPLLGPFANLFAVPLTGVIVPLGFLSLAWALVFPVGLKILGLPLTWLVALQSMIVGFFARIPHSSYRIPGPPAWTLFLFFTSGVALAAALRWNSPRRRWVTCGASVTLLISATLIATFPFRARTVPNTLEVAVLDVAQGDSILVITPKGSTLLIDGGGTFQGFRGREEHLGPDPGEDAVSPYLWSRGIQQLDAVALTHAHQDHIGGFTAVLQNFKVKRLWLGRETSAPAFVQLKELAARLHVPIEHVLRGQSFVWDGVQVDFLWPEIGPEEIAPLAKNNDSLVIRLHFGERTILLPGDAEKQVEYSMLAENDPVELRADVLKVGHHGSKNSTVPDFLAAVSPQIAIISAGEENPYGHPSPELLQRLEESGSRILRTDRDGAVHFLTDGHTLNVDCFVACPEPATESGRVQPPDHNQQKQQ